jgi:hypothetical protein
MTYAAEILWLAGYPVTIDWNAAAAAANRPAV